MDLLLDCGNTRLKWAWVDEQGAIVARGSDADYHPPALSWRPARIALAAVREGAAVQALAEWASLQCPEAFHRLRTPRALCGLTIAYEEPVRLGVDRWLAMLAAWRLIGQPQHRPLLVVDCGTAVTLDLVDADGGHRGGAIVPGLRLMAESLIGATSGIRPRPDDQSAGFPGRDTGACVQSGALMAVTGALREAIAHSDGICPGAAVIMTGGDADGLRTPLGNERIEWWPDLVFQGMREMLACCE
ncbi:type III pantothenate kinase [Natronospira bacteriovora]|uniref:Type III pantothenate kinase n=1 Tax=Natronospira bacteriovora TaxID=3069753 RepID=A0ABU0W940_9GAMM|nr:type III pantothenate kinase [Natronospira sp. AB-CW4]MDQ2070556.1 type III pantothenate kinase [Natronospira sp. AB-CW4]